LQSIKDELGEENLQKFINFVLKYLSGIEIPIKRGTFIEYRKGMLNISPIGRNCSREERNQFEIYDKVFLIISLTHRNMEFGRLLLKH
jgi:phosphomannomutase